MQLLFLNYIMGLLYYIFNRLCGRLILVVRLTICLTAEADSNLAVQKVDFLFLHEQLTTFCIQVHFLETIISLLIPILLYL